MTQLSGKSDCPHTPTCGPGLCNRRDSELPSWKRLNWVRREQTTPLNPRDVVTRMRSIEDNITGETGEGSPPLDRVVAVLLGVEYDGLDKALAAEARRVVELQDKWYRHHGSKMTPANVAALGIVQGITFAVAAQRLHREGVADASG